MSSSPASRARSMNVRQITPAPQYLSKSSEFDPVASPEIKNLSARNKTAYVRGFHSDCFHGARNAEDTHFATPVTKSISALPPPNYSDQNTIDLLQSFATNPTVAVSKQEVDLKNEIQETTVSKVKEENIAENAVKADDAEEITIKAT